MKMKINKIKMKYQSENDENMRQKQKSLKMLSILLNELNQHDSSILSCASFARILKRSQLKKNQTALTTNLRVPPFLPT